MEILFLGKKNDYHTERALTFLSQNSDVQCYTGNWKDPFPEEAHWWEGDYIVSYLSRWIVPQSVIYRARKEAINFHPGPPEYPGVGCVNFAIYDNTDFFGITVHRLAHPVDSGHIIAAKRFPIFQNDDVESLLQRTHDYLLMEFYMIMNNIFRSIPLLFSHEKWARKAYTRKELNQLSEITIDMDDKEIKRRERAVSYRDYGLTWKGYKLTK